MTTHSPDRPLAWVTGASEGLGRALALELVGRGFDVAITARRQHLLADLERETAGRCRSYPGDVTDLVAMRSIAAALGPISLAIFNAGFYDPRERGPFDAEVAWATIEANLGGAVRCADAVLPGMLARRTGCIVFVASIAGFGGIPGSASYCAAKSAIIRLAEALRLTYRRRGITIQVANPGFIRTRMTAGNEYAMPFMMPAEEAARRIASRLGKGFDITFPRRLALVAKAARLLPYRLWLWAMERATRRVTLRP